MKIGILTLPLHTNYGGNLQAWALLTTLKDMGHDAWLIDRGFNRLSAGLVSRTLLKRALLKYVLRRPGISVRKGLFDKPEPLGRTVNSIEFIERHIKPKTKRFESTVQLKKHISRYHFDAFVTGSDQVWRPEYTPNIEDFFFGFLDRNSTQKKISYAASFGTDKWHFTSKQASVCSALLKMFSAVSVRESSGIDLCRDNFGVPAIQVLDPTLLIEAHRYLELLPADAPARPADSKLFSYLLDYDPRKMRVLERIALQTGHTPFDVSGPISVTSTQRASAVPPVESWISGFRDAEFIFTDSFHGCVFSILFNKPFIAFGNPARGLARFESLLSMFKLQSRLITSEREDISRIAASPIDWSHVNDLLQGMRILSLNFLRDALARDFDGN